MEDILDILIFAVVMIIGFWSSANKKKKGNQPQAKRIKPTPTRPLVKRVPSGTIITFDDCLDGELDSFYKRPADVKPIPVPEVKCEPKPETPKETYHEPQPEIRLRTPEDARRAFIYSEIFHRKY